MRWCLWAVLLCAACLDETNRPEPGPPPSPEPTDGGAFDPGDRPNAGGGAYGSGSGGGVLRPDLAPLVDARDRGPTDAINDAGAPADGGSTTDVGASIDARR